MSTNPYLQILNLIQNNKQNEASDLMNKLSSSQINNPILYNLNGLNLIKAGKYSESVEQFKKAIEIDKFYSDPFYNLGQLYYKLGNFSNAIEYLNEASKLKKNFIPCNFLLGECYYFSQNFHSALKKYIEILDIQPHHADSFMRVLEILTFLDADSSIKNEILEVNKNIEKIYDEQSHDFFTFKKKFNDLLAALQGKIPDNDNLYTQIIKNNKKNLNCDRHFKVFNKYGIIAKDCFSCFKIQVELNNVIDLIKLYLIFNDLTLPKNNLRKCFVETRPEIPGTYKGLVYCESHDDIDNVRKILDPKIKTIIGSSAIIANKRGCSEFGKKFPSYNVFEKERLMKYNEEWDKFENLIDNNLTNFEISKSKDYVPTKKKLNLQDLLTILNWLRYAENISDMSYKKFIDIKYFKNSNYFNFFISNQINIRVIK